MRNGPSVKALNDALVVVRKKFGLTLESEKTDGGRIYRIVAGKPSKAKSKAKAQSRRRS
jgi:hypothetical protein